jgi:hypothetical protein
MNKLIIILCLAALFLLTGCPKDKPIGAGDELVGKLVKDVDGNIYLLEKSSYGEKGTIFYLLKVPKDEPTKLEKTP